MTQNWKKITYSTRLKIHNQRERMLISILEMSKSDQLRQL